MNEESQLEIIPASAIEQMSRAEVDIQIATAKKYPRVLSKVKSDMLGFATLDVETASKCFYTLPRGGKSIQGPSVRMAEIAMSCYGNMRAGSRILSVESTGDTPHVVVQGMAHDLERNTAIQLEKRRRIVSKKGPNGTRKPIDEDDITLAANACASIAFRDAVFRVIPGALVKPVTDQAIKTAIGDAKTLASRRAAAIEAFAKMGVVQARVLTMLGKPKVDDVTLDDLELLLGTYTSIKDGDITIEEAFPEPKAEMAAAATGSTDAPKDEPKKAELKQKEIQKLRKLLADAGITEGAFMNWAVNSLMLDGDYTSFDQITEANCARLVRSQALWLKELKPAEVVP